MQQPIEIEQKEKEIKQKENQKNKRTPLGQTFFSIPRLNLPQTPDKSTPKTFTLDLETLIKEKTDNAWHGRVMAYFDRNFKLFSQDILSIEKVSAMEKRIPFKEYSMSLIEIINEAQRSKFINMKDMVDILSSVYTSPSLPAHNQFTTELLFQIDIAMSTSIEHFKDGYTSGDKILKGEPLSIIQKFWTGLPSQFNLDGEKNHLYKLRYNEVERCFKRIFSAMEKSTQIIHHYANKKFLTMPCMSWSYIAVLCDAFDLDSKKVDIFKRDYQNACFGLASELVYLPDMWDFLHTANHQTIISSKDTLMNIDSMLKKQKGLQEFKPQEQNKLMQSIGKMSMI